MKIYASLHDLEKHRPPPDVASVIQDELIKLLELSDSDEIDPADGRVLLFEAGDTETQVQEHFGCSFADLRFDGVVRKGTCIVGYVLFDNQNVQTLTIPVDSLPESWRAKLMDEMGGA